MQDRQRPRSQMSDVAEDVVLQKKKKRGEPWKVGFTFILICSKIYEIIL